MPISNQYHEDLTLPLTEDAETLQIEILEEIRKVTNRLIQDPNNDFRRRINDFTQKRIAIWEKQSEAWVYSSLPAAYIKGIRVQDDDLQKLLKDVNPPEGNLSAPQFSTRGASSQISDEAREILSKFPKHFTPYAVIENAVLEDLRTTTGPVFRSARDMYRNIATEAFTSTFREANTATRRDISQSMLDAFAKRGVTGITYSNGRKVSIDTYAEMVGRSASQQATLQASANRLAERQYDLVRVTEYAGASELCAPYQGHVYSLSGESSHFPSLASVTFNGSTGLFHFNCGHSFNAYIPGVSEAISLTDSPVEQRIINNRGEAKGNRFMYEQRQKQRYNERKIREWKKKQAVALDSAQRERAGKFIRKWQESQRDLINENTFLRRKYVREAV